MQGWWSVRCGVEQNSPQYTSTNCNNHQGVINPGSSVTFFYNRGWEPGAGDGEHCGQVRIGSTSDLFGSWPSTQLYGSLNICITKLNPAMDLLVSPDNGIPGATLQLTGSGFSENNYVDEITIEPK